jgi:imidazolonepropionase-like amidohydrolase
LSVLIIRAGFVFDGEDVNSDSEVVVDEDGRVLEVRRWQPPPEGAQVIDHGQGTTLLPGLVDGHQHLSWGCTPNAVEGLRREPAAQREQTIANARRALASGVTTIQDLGDSDYAVLDVRDSARGVLTLPRLRASGPPITTPGGHCHFLTGAETEPGEVAAAVRRRAERGVDVIKVMTSGGNLTAGSLPWESQFDGDSLQVVVDEAHTVGLSVAAHAHGTAAVRTCIAVGVDAVEHCTFMTADGVNRDPDLVRELAESGIVVRTTPGMVPGAPSPPPAVATRMRQIVQGFRTLHESGAQVVVSTDAGIAPGKPHDVMAYALLQFANATGDPVGALRAGTSRAADALGLTKTCGRLAPGLAADLLAVRGEVAVDLGALLEVDGVYREGQLVAGPSSARPRLPESPVLE